MRAPRSVAGTDTLTEGTAFTHGWRAAHRIYLHWSITNSMIRSRGYTPPVCVPLSARSKRRCNHDFHMRTGLNTHAHTMSHGHALARKLRVTGEHSHLGMPRGRRTWARQSWASTAHGAPTRHTSHTTLDDRLPPIEDTHSCVRCTRDCFRKPGPAKSISKLEQGAQRGAEGYYCGYKCRRPACGEFALKGSTGGSKLC